MELLTIILISISLGSFSNNVISHFINGNKLDIFKSTCSCGKKKLGLKDLIPLLSYFVLKGKCRFCEEKLTKRYIVVELISLLIALLLYSVYKVSIEYIVFYAIFIVLTAIAVIDFYIFIVPNILVVVLLLIVASKLILKPEFILNNLPGSIGIFVLLTTLNILSKKFMNKSAIGWGDIKLLTTLYLLFGTIISLTGIWIASLVGIIAYYAQLFFRKIPLWNNKVPFAFFIAIGFFIATFFNNQFHYLINYWVQFEY